MTARRLALVLSATIGWSILLAAAAWAALLTLWLGGSPGVVIVITGVILLAIGTVAGIVAGFRLAPAECKVVAVVVAACIATYFAVDLSIDDPAYASEPAVTYSAAPAVAAPLPPIETP
ncbi:MAG: hypothetical protein JWM86_1351 [Thermoleophilia bacterium]|nr:hypothetical protein [Thermoleophilia bacterium]